MDIELPPEGPDRIVAFDPSRKRTIEVDLDNPFFKVKRTSYPECDHTRQGVTLDTAIRKVFCLCGVEIDAFDALLIYAHGERRLQSTRMAIEEHARKQAEEKARRPFVRTVEGFEMGTHGGFRLTLSCGHSATWYGKRRPRTRNCRECYRIDQLKQKGVASVGGLA